MLLRRQQLLRDLYPDTGNTYYLLDQGNWLTYQEFAVDSLGGTLAVIEDSVENAWVYNTFKTFETEPIAIGLFHDDDLDTWVGPLGEELNYVNWGIYLAWPDPNANWDYGFIINNSSGYEDNGRWCNSTAYPYGNGPLGVAEVVFVALDRVTWAQIKTQF